jgi:hypothetical protein
LLETYWVDIREESGTNDSVFVSSYHRRRQALERLGRYYKKLETPFASEVISHNIVTIEERKVR